MNVTAKRDILQNQLDIAEPPRMSTRDLILKSSLDLFSENGFQGTSIREIASCVGITKSSIYGHFRNKNEILEALLDRAGPSALNEDVSLVLAKEEDELGTLSSLLSKVFDRLIARWYSESDIKVLRLVIIEQFHNRIIREKLCWELFVQERNRFVELFLFHLPIGSEFDTDAQDLAEDLLGFVIWIRTEFFIFKDEPPTIEFIQKKIERKIAMLCQQVQKLNERDWK